MHMGDIYKQKPLIECHQYLNNMEFLIPHK